MTSRSRIVPNKGMPLKARTLPGFTQEAGALLIVGHGYSATRAAKAVTRWRLYVRKMWRQGKPPCSVADHISKWDRAKVVSPCGRRRCRGCRKKVSRDANNPQSGELFESARGNRWKVVEVKDGRVWVESAGRKAPGRLSWSPSQLRGMRSISGGSRQLSLFGNDPSRRRRGRSVVQTLIFSKDEFTREQALSWARRHRFRASKVDVTSGSYRIRQTSPARVRMKGTITMTRGIKAVVGTPR